MNVYTHQGVLLCEKCADETRAEIVYAGPAPTDETSDYVYDESALPKGPIANGGGEADSPQHCDHCGEFLDNPLTDEGRKYVEERCKGALRTAQLGQVLLKWIDAYDVDLTSLLDDFTRGYVVCALWSSTDESRDDGGDPLDDNYDVEDIAPQSLCLMSKACADFKTANANLLTESGLSDEQAGHDFWLTRNGHGAGFWDRGLGEVGDKLSKAAKAFGSSDLYVGSEGKIHLNY